MGGIDSLTGLYRGRARLPEAWLFAWPDTLSSGYCLKQEKKMNGFQRLLPVALALLVIICCLPGCTPRKQGATSQSFYASGRANFSISVTPPLTLAATGSLSATVPSDASMPPSGRFRYAVFSGEGDGPVLTHAHTIFSELPRDDWRFELETWAAPEVMSYSKARMAGKYWTVRMMTVFSSRDWFSDLWRQNGREIPEFWLAKRWSATPERNMRIVAEYREPAPLCLQKALAAAPLDDRNAPPVRGKELWRNCDREIDEFSVRADAAFNFDRAGELPAQGVATATARPASSPDMGRLVGRAEHVAWELSTGRD